MKPYQQVNGTSFHARTPPEVITVLESARQNRTRLHISFGDVQTGNDWLEPVVLPDGRVLTVDVLRDGKLHAAFENMEKARRWANKLGVAAPIAA